MKWKEIEKTFIMEKYLTMTQPEMAEELGRKLNSVKSYMSNNGITLPKEIRSQRFRKATLKMRNQLGGMKGSNNPNWRGGVSKNSYRYKLRQKKKFPEKIRAGQIVQNALRSGKLEKQRCEVCGDQNGHAHHEDYNKPLEVIWLCRKHHLQRHRS